MKRLAWVAIATLSATVVPRPAHACGGFFCSTAPIAQASERIVYGLESDGTLTMAVQIEYEGEDEDFAWILPVMAPPEISLGTEALFDALGDATDPIFVQEEDVEGTCRPLPRCVYASGVSAGGDVSGCGGGGGPSPWSGGYIDAGGEPPPVWDAGAGAEDDAGVRVISQQVVGPYDSVVLGATSARAVVEWLGENGYDIPASSIPLLEAYEDARQVFVALRLSAQRETSLIRPIVLRMPTSEVCLPIRLTAIATVPELPITAFFLGEAPVVPTNYSYAEVDATDSGFWTGWRRWDDALTAAVRERGGQAFVTEYAGPTPAVTVSLPAIDHLADEERAGPFMRTLAQRGYLADPVIRDLLERYLDPPDPERANAYYNCLALNGSIAECGAPARFDGAGLFRAIGVHIVTPRREAEALVRRHGRLTRLATTMRAEDMTIDPVFAVDEGAPEVSNVHRARLVTECSETYYEQDAPQRWEVGDESTPRRSGGPRADDEAYCRGLDAFVEGTEPRSDSSSRSGCLCGVAGTGVVQWGTFAMGMTLIALRRRRSRGPGSRREKR